MDNTLYMKLYEGWEALKPGPRAELRRISKPEDLLEQPAFYRLAASISWEKHQKIPWTRLVFCLPYLTHTDDMISLGGAIGRSEKISEKRMFQVVRSMFPNDLVQLRRILKHIKPTVNWPMTADQLWYWGKPNKRRLMENYILNKPEKKTTS